MGFLDKVKAQAEQAVKQGQDKLDEAQAKRKANDLLRDLGAWYYATQTGRDEGNGPAELAPHHRRLQARGRARPPEQCQGRARARGAPAPAAPAVPDAPGAVPPPPGAVPPAPADGPPPPGAIPPPPPPGAVPPPAFRATMPPPPPGDAPGAF
ncbi:MAG: hypothetical protein R2711_19125 [Acidimicrobiales bacterium]